MKPWLTTVLLLAAVCGLGGCYFTTRHPLPPKSEADPALLGDWRAGADAEGNSSESRALFLADTDGWLQIVLWERNYQNGELYRGFCSEVGGEKYLNVKKLTFNRRAQAPELDEDYYLVHYRVADGTRLELTLLNETLLAGAVSSGDLSGRPSVRGGADLRLTCTSRALSEFIALQAPATLLGDPLTPMHRIVPAADAERP